MAVDAGTQTGAAHAALLAKDTRARRSEQQPSGIAASLWLSDVDDCLSTMVTHFDYSANSVLSPLAEHFVLQFVYDYNVVDISSDKGDAR